ncbi:NAD(P)H-binding protein [Gammaproteobacteria bacterium]|nr:NAD(P)H-binding protein [Gammaproteobacteria bacterium]
MSKNIALIGASGNIGSKITHELLSRGFNVTAIARNPEKVDANEGVTPVAGDILQPQQLAETLKGHDAVICAASFIPNESEKLLEAIRLSGVNRYLMVGGAASLLNEDGVKVWDTLEGLPEGVMNYIKEGMRALDLLKEADDFDWTFLSPAVVIGPGERTGSFRLGKDNVVADENGESKISYDDYAIALVDELEQGNNIKARFTLGY